VSRGKSPKLAAIRLREKNREGRALKGRVHVDIDMDDLVFGSMAETMRKMMALDGCGGAEASVRIGDSDVTISRDTQMGWVERLRGFSSLAQSVAPEKQAEACKSMLEADGWVLAGGTLKTPSWMEEHHEAPVGDAKKIPGLEWLGEI
jgi:hypothetical protein